MLPVENWHPTANVAIYRIVFAVWDHPAAVLALQCALMWGGLAGVALAAQRRWSRPVARYFVPIGFLPIVFNYLGALMKDTLSAGFTVVAVALLLLERTTTRNRGWFLVGAALCLWPAYLVKISTLPIVVALLGYVVVRAIVHWRRQSGGVRRARRRGTGGDSPCHRAWSTTRSTPRKLTSNTRSSCSTWRASRTSAGRTRSADPSSRRTGWTT